MADALDAADTRQCEEEIDGRRQFPLEFLGDPGRRLLERQCPPVVAQTLPEQEDLVEGRSGQRREIGEAFDEVLILSQDPLHLGLLQHHLGDQDAIGVPGEPPGQAAAVLMVVVVNEVPECFHIGNSRRRR